MRAETRWILAMSLLPLVLVLTVWTTGITLAQTGEWSPPANVSNTEGSGYAPRLAVDPQNTLHLVWYDWEDLDPHWPYIVYASKATGGSWTPYSYVPVKVQGIDPAMVAGTDGALHVVWQTIDGIRYIRRAPGGTWGGAETVATGSDLITPDVAIAPDGTVHAVWHKQNFPGDAEIYHRARSPGGTWGTPNLVYSGEDAGRPLIGTDTASTAHLLIDNSGTVAETLSAHKPSGQGWSPPQVMTFAASLRSPEQLASDCLGRLHLVWTAQEAGSCGVLYSIKPFGGAWAHPAQAFHGACHYHDVHSAAVAADGSGLAHLAFTVKGEEKSMWYVCQSAGMSWSSPSLVSVDLPGYDHTPSLAVDGWDGRHVAWDSGPESSPPEGDGRGEIWYSGIEGLPAVTAIITPGGGTLSSASGNVNLDFPAGSVTTDTLVTHTPAPSSPSGGLVGVSFFQLTAERCSDGVPMTSFDPPYTLSAGYTDAQKGPAIESTLGLYWWDGGQWQLEPTSSVHEAQNRVTASVNHMTLFSVLGETNRVYLPLVLRN
jgi:hypothetical protein